MQHFNQSPPDDSQPGSTRRRNAALVSLSTVALGSPSRSLEDSAKNTDDGSGNHHSPTSSNLNALAPPDATGPASMLMGSELELGEYASLKKDRVSPDSSSYAASMRGSALASPLGSMSRSRTLRLRHVIGFFVSRKAGVRSARVTLAVVVICVLLLIAFPQVVLDGFTFVGEQLDGGHYAKHVPHPDLPDAVLIHHPTAEKVVSDREVTLREALTEVRLTPHQLPSWTLHVVRNTCPNCTDNNSFIEALQETKGRVDTEAEHLFHRYTALATTTAPMGLIGPMLLAMSSVTNNVNITQELGRWTWMLEAFRAHTPNGARSRHIAVMGVPSMDKPHSAQLRKGQRATWGNYRDVARAASNFEGALLPLYILAGGDHHRADVKETASHGPESHHGAVLGKGANVNVDELLPTTEEFHSASACYLPGEEGEVNTGCLFTKRRVELRENWNSKALAESPCSRVSLTTEVAEGTPIRHADEHAVFSEMQVSALYHLSSAFSLPVTPAFAAPARYICHASSALWLEALEHRDMLWLDMLTDKRQHAKGKSSSSSSGNHGQQEREIGLTQKVVLWLNYAYDRFPTVPYILKAEDDVYVKVPQFISNIRYMRAGQQERVKPPGLVSDKAHPVYTTRDPANMMSEDECYYWMRSFVAPQKFAYGSGMLYLLDRRLVLAAIERPVSTTPGYVKRRLQPRTAEHVDVVRLASYPYDSRYSGLYADALMFFEEVLVGHLLASRSERAKALCPHKYVRYIREGPATFFDVREMGRGSQLTWASVAMDKCQASDLYYIHHFFEVEHTEARPQQHGKKTAKPSNRKADNRARDWAEKHISKSLPGYGDWPRAKWVHDVDSECGSTYAPGDNVTVYNMRYAEHTSKRMRLFGALRTVPFMKKDGCSG